MVKIALSALIVALLCMLQVQASHYILFILNRRANIGIPFSHTAGICIHDGNRILMADGDQFAPSVVNYGFHKDGYSANVNWNNKNVGVKTWGTYRFDNVEDSKGRASWDGCWTTQGNDCNDFRDRARWDCEGYLDI
ncbi:MAG: hypothetical protein J3R72DRAFT_431046 [Linnemannia gamsii]|nr:MAG: hypothetical protein J3R72DRAFT_431046 [Linnemannia gamsii]